MPLYRREGSPFWWVRIGRKTRRSTGTEDREKAEEFERVLTERLWRRDKLGDRAAVSWSEATERWLKESKRARKRDREFISILAEELGEYPVSAIAHPDVIEELRTDGLARGWSHSTVDRMMRTVGAVLRACIRWRYLESIPHIPMYGEPEAEPRFLTEEQFAALCRELPAHLRLAARFAVVTLLRMREQSRLTWDRVNLEARTAWVPRGQMKGRRTHSIPLTAEAVAILKAARQLIPGARVFGQENFHTKAFQKAAARAGVPWLRWHDLRHTGASWAVQSGVTLPELMELGGWRSYRMVLRYAHLAPANTVKAAERVAQRAHRALSKKGARTTRKSLGKQ
jgi:integrase